MSFLAVDAGGITLINKNPGTIHFEPDLIRTAAVVAHARLVTRGDAIVLTVAFFPTAAIGIKFRAL